MSDVNKVKSFDDYSNEKMQKLMDRKYVTVTKTKMYESDDEMRLKDPGEEFDIKPWGPPGKVYCWSYRFKFNNQARKRRFFAAVLEAPPQEWDDFVKWQNDISNYGGEITVEAQVRVPPEESGKFRYQFEQFYTRIVLKDD